MPKRETRRAHTALIEQQKREQPHLQPGVFYDDKYVPIELPQRNFRIGKNKKSKSQQQIDTQASTDINNNNNSGNPAIPSTNNDDVTNPPSTDIASTDLDNTPADFEDIIDDVPVIEGEEEDMQVLEPEDQAKQTLHQLSDFACVLQFLDLFQKVFTISYLF